jgi:ribonuclease T2
MTARRIGLGAALALLMALAPQRVLAQATEAPGAFDFYVLTLSWSPGFCDTGGAAKSPDQCAVGSGDGFVALRATHGLFPTEGLARYEWRKHGTCTGLSPEAYFADIKFARDEIFIPETLKAPREQMTMAPIDLQRAFIAANDNLHRENMAIGCARGELEDVRICLSKDLRAFADCPEVARQTCRAGAINVPPIH